MGPELGLMDVVQTGAFGIFAWYAYMNTKELSNNNKEWRAYLSERNSKMETALNKLADAVNTLSGKRK